MRFRALQHEKRSHAVTGRQTSMHARNNEDALASGMGISTNFEIERYLGDLTGVR